VFEVTEEPTLRAELTALFEGAGLVDADVDAAVADEHARSGAYHRVISMAVGSCGREGDRALAAALARDPEPLTAKTAVVELIDKVAENTADPEVFRQWAAEILPETDRFGSGKDREFVRQRVRDWQLSLAVENGQVPDIADVAAVSDWMQRRLADFSTSSPVLTLLAEHGRTKKTRNVAKNRAGSGAR
jgi:hypothetical protein